MRITDPGHQREVDGHSTLRHLYSPRKNPWCPLDRGLDWPQSRCVVMETTKFLVPAGNEIPVIHSAARYPGS
jgi:hypothetical protein